MKSDTISMNGNRVGLKRKPRNKPFLCPCCDNRYTTWWARYNHLQLVHRWGNPPNPRYYKGDKHATKNPEPCEIQKILDDSAELGEKLQQVTRSCVVKRLTQ